MMAVVSGRILTFSVVSQ